MHERRAGFRRSGSAAPSAGSEPTPTRRRTYRAARHRPDRRGPARRAAGTRRPASRHASVGSASSRLIVGIGAAAAALIVGLCSAQRPGPRVSHRTDRRAHDGIGAQLTPDTPKAVVTRRRNAGQPPMWEHPGLPWCLIMPLYRSISRQKGSHDFSTYRPRRDRHRLRAGRLHRGHLRRARPAHAAGVRGHPVRWRADDHDRGGELPRLPRRHHRARADGPDARAGAAVRRRPADGGRRRGVAGRPGEVGHRGRRDLPGARRHPRDGRRGTSPRRSRRGQANGHGREHLCHLRRLLLP